jgi:GTPase involved in cell partitioning and DNA repair
MVLETGTLEVRLANSRYSQPGCQGTEMDVILELKVLADVGLVGFQWENQLYCQY